MSYLLDTNTWIRYLNDSNAGVVKRMAETPPEELHLCSVVKAELFYGAERSTRREANLLLLSQLFARFLSLSLDDAAAAICGHVRAQLAAKGTPIGPSDFMIAAIALANDLTLVTHNTDEFSRVEGLRLEDWEASA